jgi:ribosomal protein S18 acetylase RimI-like enzyme
MNVTLKETKDLDFDRVVDLFYEVHFLSSPEKRGIYTSAIKQAFLNSQYVVGAYVNDKLVGFVRVLTDESLFATIWNMIVDPKYQNMGIGEKLISKCLSHYPNLHFFLFADDDTQGFYEKTGFTLHKHGMFLEKGREVCVIYT